MATLSEHAYTISAAIQAALAEGLMLEFDLSYNRDDFVDHVDVDLWDGNDYITVYDADC